MKLEPINFICPKCGSGNYMRLLVGSNVGRLDTKCINCNSYFNFDDLYNKKIGEALSQAVQQEAEWTHTADPRCSHCNNYALPGWDGVPFQSRYCPHCGKKMKNPEAYE